MIAGTAILLGGFGGEVTQKKSISRQIFKITVNSMLKIMFRLIENKKTKKSHVSKKIAYM